MDKRKTNKLEETKRLLKWIANNNADWKRITGYGELMTPDEYLHYFHLLKKLEFYEVWVVFIFMNQEALQTYDSFEKLGVKKLSEEWNQSILKEFEDFVINEVNSLKWRKERYRNSED